MVFGGRDSTRPEHSKAVGLPANLEKGGWWEGSVWGGRGGGREGKGGREGEGKGGGGGDAYAHEGLWPCVPVCALADESTRVYVYIFIYIYIYI